MTRAATIQARIEPQTKRRAERVLRKLGVTPAEAIRVFYRQICLRGGLPFPVELPNDLTARTLSCAREGKGVKEFRSLDEMFRSWEK